MLRSGANLGGEQSGHIIFLDDATTGDGMLTALKIASLVSMRGPLESLVAGLKIFPQTMVNVQVNRSHRSIPARCMRLLAAAEPRWEVQDGWCCGIPGPNRWFGSWWKRRTRRRPALDRDAGGGAAKIDRG